MQDPVLSNVAVALVCSLEGKILHVLQPDAEDRFPVVLGADLGDGFLPTQPGRVSSFLDEINTNGFAFGWRFLRTDLGENEPVYFAGGKINDRILVVGDSRKNRLPEHFFSEVIHWKSEDPTPVLTREIRPDLTRDELTSLNMELNSERERMKVLSEYSPDYMYSLRVLEDGSLEPEWISEAFTRLTGYRLSDLSGMPVAAAIASDGRARLQQRVHKLLGGNRDQDDFMLVTKTGEVIWVHDLCVPVWDAVHERVVRLVGVGYDESEKKLLESELCTLRFRMQKGAEELERRSREISLFSEMSSALQKTTNLQQAYQVISTMVDRIFPGIPGALLALSEEGGFLREVLQWGHPETNRPGINVNTCRALRGEKPGGDREAFRAPFSCSRCWNPSGAQHLCLPLTSDRTAIGILRLDFSALEDEIPEPQARLAAAVAEQISLVLSNHSLLENLREQALRDPLTGLYNRPFLFEALGDEILQADSMSAPLSLILLDIDNFKHINDAYGQAAGDLVLHRVAHAVKQVVRTEDLVCRYGGEEFVVLLISSPLDGAIKRAQQMVAKVAHLQVEHAGKVIASLSMCAGVSTYPVHGKTGDDIIRAADEALTLAKDRGPGSVIVARGTANKPNLS